VRVVIVPPDAIRLGPAAEPVQGDLFPWRDSGPYAKGGR
jgi:hypothetical protein